MLCAQTTIQANFSIIVYINGLGLKMLQVTALGIMADVTHSDV